MAESTKEPTLKQKLQELHSSDQYWQRWRKKIKEYLRGEHLDELRKVCSKHVFSHNLEGGVIPRRLGDALQQVFKHVEANEDTLLDTPLDFDESDLFPKKGELVCV